MRALMSRLTQPRFQCPSERVDLAREYALIWRRGLLAVGAITSRWSFLLVVRSVGEPGSGQSSGEFRQHLRRPSRSPLSRYTSAVLAVWRMNASRCGDLRLLGRPLTIMRKGL